MIKRENKVKNRVLIIGKTSYIGTAFSSYINQRYHDKMWIVDLVGASDGEWKEINFHAYDTILHTAAIVHIKESKYKENIYYAVNYELAVEVANKAKMSGVKQFVFLSTMAVYGNENGSISELTDTKPCTYYGKSKLAAEKAILKMDSEEFKAAVLRIPMVYGTNCKGNFIRLIKIADMCPIFPEIQNKRSMIYIDNLCEYLRIIIENKYQGIGIPQNTETVQTTKLFCAVREVQGKRTFTVKYFNTIIKMLEKRLVILNKIFGDCYFISEPNNSKPMADGWIRIDKKEYNIIGFTDSIKKIDIESTR